MRRPSRRVRETRAKILAAARTLFAARGYGASMIKDIAVEAGVSEQTVYFHFHNKHTILADLLAVDGEPDEGATDAPSWVEDVLATTTAREHFERLVHHLAAHYERSASVLTVAGIAAAADPIVADIWGTYLRARDDTHHRLLAALVDKPGLRPDRSGRPIGDIMHVLLHPQGFDELVGRRQWSADSWASWVIDVLAAQFLTDQ